MISSGDVFLILVIGIVAGAVLATMLYPLIFKSTKWPTWFTVGRSCGTSPAFDINAVKRAKELNLNKTMVIAFVGENVSINEPWKDYFVIRTNDVGEALVKTLLIENKPE